MPAPAISANLLMFKSAEFPQTNYRSRPKPSGPVRSWRFVSDKAGEPAGFGQGRALPDQAADRVEAAGVEGGAHALRLFGIRLEFSLGADKIGHADGARRVGVPAPFNPERRAAAAVPAAAIRPLGPGTPSGKTSRPPGDRPSIQRSAGRATAKLA
jgi:hypothetical protein